MLMGTSTPNLGGSDFAAANSSYGPLAVRRSYQGAAATYPGNFLGSTCNAHIDWDSTYNKTKYVSVYSMKPNIVDAGTSALDADLDNFLESIPENHRAILTIWHEGDGKVRQGTFTKAQWQAATEHFLTRIQAFGAPYIYGAIILEAYQPADTSNSAHTQYAEMINSDWYGDGIIDIILVDGYSDLGTRGAVWDKFLNYNLSAADIPWGVAECGVDSGTVTGTWMSDQVQYCRDNDAEVFCWFDNTVGAVLATPGTTAAGLASAQMASKVLYQDPSTWVL
jgi:hypothetical protein